MKIKNKSMALSLFEEAASKHAEATEQGDYKTGNKCYDKIAKVVDYLKAENALDSLFELLDHSSVGVRLWASTYLLPIDEQKGIAVLEGIMKQNGIHALSAETTLLEWKKGHLKL